jgi:bifunctional non-homologous end joining protein LigD
LLAGAEHGRVQLATRNGVDATPWFPEIVRALTRLRGGPHVLDGEVCVLDEYGRSDFDSLQARAHGRCYYTDCDPVLYCVFDLLAVEGRSTVALSIEARKKLLAQLLAPYIPSLLYVGHFDAEHGREAFKRAVQLDLEGIVAKRLGSLYRPGERSPDWVNIKREEWQDR